MIPDTEDTDSTIQIEPVQLLPTKLDIMYLLKQIHSRQKYSKDTLLASLLLLKKVDIQPQSGLAKLFSAGLLFIAAKVH